MHDNQNHVFIEPNSHTMILIHKQIRISGEGKSEIEKNSNLNRSMPINKQVKHGCNKRCFFHPVRTIAHMHTIFIEFYE